MEEGDSNALILPAKKKNKKKVKTQIQACEKKVLRKSQKRKLKKLQEEKEKEQLLAKSLEVLERCKIREDAYSFLLSSEKIGQVMTMREKRRRDVQFSKAGLEVPENDPLIKKKKIDSCETDVDSHGHVVVEVPDENAISLSVPIESAGITDASTLSLPSQGLDYGKGSGDDGGSELNKPIKEVADEDTGKGMQLDAGDSSPNNDKKTSAAVEEVDDAFTVEAKCLEGDSFPQHQITPTVVHVDRPKDVEESRHGLPIIMMEQEIMEAIKSHNSVIICGETGCGKTTQVPQFLYEAGYGSSNCSMTGGVIGVTQPRRVAVLSTAKRVAYELGLRLGKEVGFQVRHDKKIGENCSIKFMTDGILLRELQNDFLLKRYSVLILDEAHERSLNTDILIGMLSRVIELRQKMYEDQQKRMLAGEFIKLESIIFPLKFILMSATLRVEDFTCGRRIFNESPPVLEIPTRQFPVVKHFSKKTELVDYIGEAYKKVLKMHKRLPPGGILVFVTGQREVEYLCRKLRNASKQFRDRISDTENETAAVMDACNMKEINDALDARASFTDPQVDRFSYDEHCDESDDYESYSSDSLGTDSELDSESDNEDLADQNITQVDANVVNFSEGDVNLDSLKSAFEALTGKTAANVVCVEKEKNSTTSDIMSNMSNPSPSKENKREKDPVVGPLHVLPLYAMLPAAAQLRVFEEAKEGERLVVVATNVAETSLTIPGIRYVVDTGREKVKKYNSSNGMESYEIQWISKASAAQRAGRAGRTGPGHCYCLYSSAAFTNEFPEFSCAEILKIPVDGVVLLMKSMGISKVVNFPFPTPPDANALVEAERCLKALEALDSEGRLTPLGKTMAQYPMSPRHSRLLLLAIQVMKKEIRSVRPNLVLGYAIAVAAALSLSNPFLLPFNSSQSKCEGSGQDQESQEYQDQQDKLMRKQMKDVIKHSRKKFFNIRSDALTIAYALQCFEQSKNASQFCNDNALHLKTMEEMSKLRKQLLQLVFNQRYCGLQQEFLWAHGTIEDIEHTWRVSSDKCPLYQIEEDILCQAICAGWADRVAKRKKAIGNDLAEGDKKFHNIPYEAYMVKEPVYLRRRSSISSAAPEFLVYNEMLHTKRPYIHGATSVEPNWLVAYAGSLCTFSAPLPDPKPFYDHESDQVFCYVTPSFGPWVLPISKVPIKDVQQRVVVFAYALLDGQVLPCLKPVKKFLAAPASNILKPEALGQKRVGNLLSKLKTRLRTIDSCAMLREAWSENPQLLHSEVLDWFQDGFCVMFQELWQKMHHESLLAPPDRFHDSSKKKKKGHAKS